MKKKSSNCAERKRNEENSNDIGVIVLHKIEPGIVRQQKKNVCLKLEYYNRLSNAIIRFNLLDVDERINKRSKTIYAKYFALSLGRVRLFFFFCKQGE